MENSVSEQIPRIYQPAEIIDKFTQIEAAKNLNQPPRPDIVKLINEYKTWKPIRVGGRELADMESYCDFLPGRVTTILTRSGKERKLGQVAQNFTQLKSELPPEFVQYIENLSEFFQDKEQATEDIPPLLLLKDPEVFNGQIVDGVHRSLAYISKYQATEGIYDPDLPAFIGENPTNKVMLRKLKQSMVREWRRIQSPMLK